MTTKGKKREKQTSVSPVPEVTATTSESTATTGTFHIGCAIWAYDGWTDNFFPKGTPKDKRLHTYAQRLTAVEINSTFYAVPAVPIVKKWAEEVPDSFRFCPKFPKAITHTAQLVNVDAQTATFIGTMRVLGTRLGPLMLQLPPSFGPMRLPMLQKFLEHVPTDLEITVEVRHPEWFKDANSAKLDKMLADRKASRVVFDVRPAHESNSPDASSAQEKKPDVPLVAVATQPFVVVRYIASPVPEENTPFFEEWIPRLATWLNEGRRVYFFVHCPLEERSPEFAREVYTRLSKVVALPALPWDAVKTPAMLPLTSAETISESPVEAKKTSKAKKAAKNEIAEVASNPVKVEATVEVTEATSAKLDPIVEAEAPVEVKKSGKAKKATKDEVVEAISEPVKVEGTIETPSSTDAIVEVESPAEAFVEQITSTEAAETDQEETSEKPDKPVQLSLF